MGETIQKRISALMLSNRKHARYLAVLACMALAVVFGVSSVLRQQGVAKTHEVKVLQCSYNGTGAHTHDASCYDADGNLVCTLTERALHTHDDSCYTSETYLVCGMEEGEGAHTHDESCFDEEGNLICEIEESEGHVHTDECWQTDTWLSCGLEEVTEEHVHGEGCFTTVVVDDGEDEPVDNTNDQPADDPTNNDDPVDDQGDVTDPADPKEPEPAEAEAEVDEMGEQTFEGILKDTDGNIILTVNVKAPAGAFPAGTTMKIAGIAAQDVAEIEQKLNDAVKKAEGEDAQVKQWQGVDITFFDKDGNEIEPAKDVEVKITSSKVNEIEDPLLVHVVDWTKDSAQGKTEDAEVLRQVDVVNADENDTTVGTEDTFKFKTDEFSPYIIVETIIDSGEGEIVFEGSDYTLKITYTKESKIPAGTKLTVTEIDPNSAEYLQCLGKAWDAVNADYLKQEAEIAKQVESDDVSEDLLVNVEQIKPVQFLSARFFDITLTYNDEEIEPEVPVNVEITYKDGLSSEKSAKTEVVHFDEKKTEPEIIADVTTEATDTSVQSISYEQGSFSITGYTVTKQSETEIEGAGGDEAPVSLGITGGGTRGNVDPATIEVKGGKSVTPNNDTDGDGEGDGTYTLALDVIGEAITVEEPTKANVVIVLDFSGSMFGTEGKYVYKEASAPYPTGTTYYGYTGSQTIISGACYDSSGWHALTRVSGTDNFTYNGNPWTRKVYTREYSWYSERAALTKLINTLMAYNEKWEGQDDVVEISLVGFGLYAKVLQDWTNSKDDCLTAINAIKNHLETFTNWEAGYRCAVDRVENIAADRADAPTYVMFLTDGNPNRYCNGEGWGKSVAATCSAANGIVYSRDDARKLVTDYGCTVYNIFSYGPSSQMPNLRRLNNYAQTGVQNDSTAQDNVTFFDASHDESLYNALSAIASEISEGLTFGGVQVLDGITTGVTSTTVTNAGDVKNFRYAVKTEFGSTVYTVEQTDNGVIFTANGSPQAGTLKTLELDYDGDGTVDETKEYYEATFGGATYKMCLANVDSNGLITWDLGGVGTLQPGWTYELSCIMWPEQECYDLLADLNNGDTTEHWDDSIATPGPEGSNYTIGGFAQYPYIVKYDNGTYGVLTNTNQSIKYRVVETDPEGNVTYGPVKTLPLDPQEPMPLDVSATQITKEWDDSLDPQELIDLINAVGADSYSVTLHVYKDDNDSTPFKTFVFKPTWNATTETYDWNTEDISLPCGVMVSEAMASSSGLLSTTSCNDGNKVVIDGVTYYVLEGGHEYWIEEETTDYHFEFEGDHILAMEVDGDLKYVELDDDGNMIAIKDPEVFAGTNHLKGGLNVTKEIEVPEGIEEINGVDVDDLIASATFDIKVDLLDAEGNPLDTDTCEGLGYRVYYGEYNPNHGTADRSEKYEIHDGTFTQEIYVGDTIRIGNLPTGTTYSVYEVDASGNPVADGGTMDIYNVTYTFDDDGKTIELNTADHVTVTNTPVADLFKLIKVDTENPGTAQEPGTTLEGAKFDLYGDDYYTTGGAVNPDAEPLFTDLVSDENGVITVGHLAYGTYYLVETEAPSNAYSLLSEPVKAVFSSDGWSYYQAENSLDSDHSGEGIYVDTETSESYDIITIVVTNSKGAVLPKTGGPGTTLFTIVGSAVCIAAVVMYGFTSRRGRERRFD